MSHAKKCAKYEEWHDVQKCTWNLLSSKMQQRETLRSSLDWCGGWGSCQDQDIWQLQRWHGNGCFGCLQWWWHNQHPGSLHLPSETPTSELYCRSVAFLSSHLSANPLHHLNCKSIILQICVFCINLTYLEILIYYCPTVWHSSIPQEIDPMKLLAHLDPNFSILRQSWKMPPMNWSWELYIWNHEPRISPSGSSHQILHDAQLPNVHLRSILQLFTLFLSKGIWVGTLRENVGRANLQCAQNWVYRLLNPLRSWNNMYCRCEQHNFTSNDPWLTSVYCYDRTNESRMCTKLSKLALNPLRSWINMYVDLNNKISHPVTIHTPMWDGVEFGWSWLLLQPSKKTWDSVTRDSSKGIYVGVGVRVNLQRAQNRVYRL